MRRFLIVLSLIIFTTDSAFARCDKGYYDPIRPRVDSENYCYKNFDGSGSDVGISCSGNGTWKANWSNSQYPAGTVSGIVTCNTTKGSIYSATDENFSQTNTGEYCWCKMQTWQPASGSTVTYSSKWYYMQNFADISSQTCETHCAFACGYIGAHSLHPNFFESASNAENCTACPSSVKPTNAYWNDYGTCTWKCNAGYSGTSCTQCPAKPDNSSWGSGCNWTCNTGYSQSEHTTTIAFVAPTSTGDNYQYKARSGASSSYSSNSDGDLSTGQWKVTWTSGNVTGTAIGETSCNGNTGTMGTSSTTSMSTTSTGKYCWCKFTSWNGTSATANWVYYNSNYSNNSCRNNCAKNCAQYVSENATMRSGVFGAITSSLTVSTTTYTCDACSKPANSSWSTGCDWTCDANYYNSSSNTCSTVGAGYYSPAGDNNRYACPTNPTGSEWTSGCDWRCVTGYYGGAGITAPTTSGSYQYRAINGSTWYTSNADGDLSNGQWKVTWTSGNVTGTAKGESFVATTGGTQGQPTYGDLTASASYRCWCRMTEWNGTTVNSPWVYYGSEGTNYCAASCGQYVSSNATMRSGVFSAAKVSCATCPTGGTSVAGNNTTITQCYVPTSTTMTDAAGTYTFSSNCYYTN